jgi:hypothetical protein
MWRARAMDDVLTLEEIEARFDQEWVLLADPRTTEQMEVISGRLLWHSKSRDEVWRKAHELQLRHAAVFHVGEPQGDIAFVL